MPPRERYFTPETIAARAADILRPCAEVRSAPPEAIVPARAALLVLDMQRFFLDQESHACAPSAAAILPNVSALIKAFRARGLPLIFTRHLNARADAGRMAVWWRDLIAPGSPAAEIVFDTAADPVLVKHQYDAFHGTALEAMLRERGVEQLIVTGVLTHLCCETTARAAFMRGFAVFFVADGTATYTESFHRASLLNLAHGFATPLLSAQALAALEAHDGS